MGLSLSGISVPGRISANSVSIITTDPYYNNVSLLLHGDGTEASTVFTDNSPSPKTMTPLGSAQINTAIKKFGTGSIYLSNNNSYITTPTVSALQMGTGDFTLEVQCYPLSINPSPPQQNLININTYTDGILFRLAGAALDVYIGGSQKAINTGNVITPNVWQHVALVRASGSIRAYVNGTPVGVTDAAPENITAAGTTYIGRAGHYNNEFFSGYLDEIRITKGVARYTGAFTAPTAAFPNS